MKKSELVMSIYRDSRPASDEDNRGWAVRITHIPSGLVGTGDSVGDSGRLARRKAFRHLRVELNKGGRG